MKKIIIVISSIVFACSNHKSIESKAVTIDTITCEPETIQNIVLAFSWDFREENGKVQLFGETSMPDETKLGASLNKWRRVFCPGL